MPYRTIYVQPECFVQYRDIYLWHYYEADEEDQESSNLYIISDGIPPDNEDENFFDIDTVFDIARTTGLLDRMPKLSQPHWWYCPTSEQQAWCRAAIDFGIITATGLCDEPIARPIQRRL